MSVDVATLQAWASGLVNWGIGLVVLMLLDGISGGLEAWMSDKFSWEYFPRFLKTGLIFTWVWIVFEILGVVPTFLNIQISGFEQALADYGPKAVFAFIAVSKYLASILKHAKAIYELQNPEPVV